MNFTLVWQLAVRYLRGKRAANVVPLLSRISMGAIAVSSAAMIIVFSVFNGLEGLVKDMYKAFYPEVRVTVVKGKFFSLDDNRMQAIKKVPGVSYVSTVLEDNVLATSQLDSEQEQKVLAVKGIDKNYLKVNDLDQYIIDGADSVSNAGRTPTAIIGRKIADQMGLDITNIVTRLAISYPNSKLSGPPLDPGSAFQRVILKPEGVFMVQEEFDSKYILAPLAVVQDLFLENGKYSSIEIGLAKGADADEVKHKVQEIIGSEYKTETRFEQNRTVYMLMRTEKWAVYAVLVLVLLIASFNMIGSLSMLVLEKRKDMAILKTMGAQPADIRMIFLLEGVLWTLTGGVTGIVLGFIVCEVQKYFQLVKMGGSFVVDAYPVALHWTDFILVIVTIIIVGMLAAWYPSGRATKTEDPSLKAT